MRYLTVFILSLLFVASANAADSNQRTHNSWKDGIWTLERTESFEDYQLFSWGLDFLNGLTVSPNPTNAEILFEGYANKDQRNAIHIGLIYLDYSEDIHENGIARQKSFQWFSRSIKAYENESKKWLGVLMRLTGLDIQKSQLANDPPNMEAIAWLLSASKYGDAKAVRLTKNIEDHFNSIEMNHISKRSVEILNDPVGNYKIFNKLKIAPSTK